MCWGFDNNKNNDNNDKNNPHLNIVNGAVLGDKEQGVGIREKGKGKGERDKGKGTREKGQRVRPKWSLTLGKNLTFPKSLQTF